MTNTMKTIAVMHAILLSGLFVSQAQAASACKGLDNSACNNAAQCGWVQSYERKDGRQVKSFCRTKAKKSAANVTSGKSNSLLSKVTKVN